MVGKTIVHYKILEPLGAGGTEEDSAMSSSMISRREFGQLMAAGLVAGGRGSGLLTRQQPTSIRVAAVQMVADLANAEGNLSKADGLVRVALSRGAQWVILPEFFTSGMAFHPDLADATRAIDGSPTQMLLRLAREGNAVVGGSFLAWRDGNAFNTFVLALPDGSIRQHDKDQPSFWENCYYVGGNDDGVVETPAGNVGIALCWEFIRSNTAARLKDKVGMVVGGSCWWTVPNTVPAEDPGRALTLEILQDTPGRFARMLGVPVVHASHAGSFEGGSWPSNPNEPYRSHYLGEAQIVDGRGAVLARMSREEGDGVIVADVTVGATEPEREPVPTDFWTAPYPDEAYERWERQLESGHDYYVSNTLPRLRRQFDRV